MKIVLKTITGKQHEVDVEPTSTVLDVKKLMEEEYEPASLRLCYNGAVLEDAKTLTETGVKEGDSLVLAGRKRKIPKPQPQAPAEPPKAESAAPTTTTITDATSASSAPAMVNASGKPSSMEDITTPSNAAPAAAAAPTAAAAPSATTATAPDTTDVPTASVPPTSFLSSAAPSAAPQPPPVSAAPATNTYGAPANLIDEICSMGFEDRSQIALALRAAYMNVDRAVEYLFDGIPQHLLQELTRTTASAAPTTATIAVGNAEVSTSSTAAPSTAAAPPTTSAGAAAAPSAAETELRAALATIPQFDQIRALYAQNTDTLPVVTQQIALRHPAVYEQIERNPEAFLAIMSESGAPGSSAAGATSQGAAVPSTADGTAPEETEESIMNQLPAELELTADDRVAVQQLVELGGGMWDEQSALLVYLATQRNQEVAASILFEHGGVPPELLAEIANQMAEEDGDEYEDEQQ